MSKYNHLATILGARVEADARPNPRGVGARIASGNFVIELSRIVPDPDQPRKQFDDDELERLAASLKHDGQLEPIRVRYDAGRDRYVIVFGERRYRAAHRAGLTSLHAIVDDSDMEPGRLTALQLVENALRADLSPMETARAYQQLMTTWNCTQQELAQRLSVSPTKVSRTLAVLTLPPEVREDIEAGRAGAVTVVQQVRRKRPAKRKTKPVRLVTPCGVVVVTPAAGHTVADVLAAALEQSRQRDAA